MPGGQITVIAARAAIIAATAAVIPGPGRTALSGCGAGMAAPVTGTGRWHAPVRRWPEGDELMTPRRGRAVTGPGAG